MKYKPCVRIVNPYNEPDPNEEVLQYTEGCEARFTEGGKKKRAGYRVTGRK